MKSATLLREPSTDEGTFGRLTTDDGELSLVTLELPWRDENGDGIGDPRRSCITAGVYYCAWHKSPHVASFWPHTDGWCYEVRGVAQRSDILIHPANWAGDVDRGWQSQLIGCIAVGYRAGKLTNKHGQLQRAIVRDEQGRGSRNAFDALNAWGARDDILLQIIEPG